MNHSEGSSEEVRVVSVDEITSGLYAELREIARQRMFHERCEHTLSPTALVNEAWLRMKTQHNLQSCERQRFVAAASNTMRRVLIDWARGTDADKRRPPGDQVMSLSADDLEPDGDGFSSAQMLLLSEAFELLEQDNSRAASTATMRILGGLADEEIAAVLEVSTSTVKRDWQFARAFIVDHLSAD